MIAQVHNSASGGAAILWNRDHWDLFNGGNEKLITSKDSNPLRLEYYLSAFYPYEYGDVRLELFKLEDMKYINGRYCAVILSDKLKADPSILVVSYHGMLGTEKQKYENAVHLLKISAFTAACFKVPLLLLGDFNADMTRFITGDCRFIKVPGSYGEAQVIILSHCLIS